VFHLFQELEEVLMTMVGGLDVHRQQITFDYVDDDGLVRSGQIRPATRKTLRGWLGEHCPQGDAEFKTMQMTLCGLSPLRGSPTQIRTSIRVSLDYADICASGTVRTSGNLHETGKNRGIGVTHLIPISG
jgi:hypothetical protein